MKLNPLTERRIRRFKAIKRGYWCFIIVTTAFTLSLFLELFMNHKALVISFDDVTRYPAVANWLNGWVPFAEFNDTARAKDFGLPGEAEIQYREFARWVGDPEGLEKDAAKIEREIAEDEDRFRAKLTQIFSQRGETYDSEAPLPEFKVAEYGAAIAKVHSYGMQVLASFVVGFDAAELVEEQLDRLAGDARGETQMPLFRSPASPGEGRSQRAKVSVPPAPAGHGRLEELGEALRILDLEKISGLEALLWLHDWRRRLQSAGGKVGVSDETSGGEGETG